MTNYSKAANQIENARLLEKLTANGGPDVDTFDGWKMRGRFVKRGEKSKSFQVNAGVVRVGIDPISGEDRYEAKWRTAYGFTIDQTAAY